jgi:hypothetical protein
MCGVTRARVDEWPYPDGADFIVLRDPDGNEFCVIDHPDYPDAGSPASAGPADTAASKLG